ncbi:MAG: DUF1801 domain-containing protein [Anaerolineales bacterium]|nr:DUF1801 domain-containing protein [Anaerolineales bacterium]MCB8937083.1 DUF1801 domain-containing protein [Ardenticatenaceae bacterium]
MSEEFTQMLATANPEVATLAAQARALLQDVMPEVVEVVWPTQNIAGYGVGPKKMSEQFCYIALFKNRINLGFYYGADLPDPHHLLEGTGQNLRHVKISQPEQLENSALRTLVEAASKHLPKLKK